MPYWTGLEALPGLEAVVSKYEKLAIQFALLDTSPRKRLADAIDADGMAAASIIKTASR